MHFSELICSTTVELNLHTTVIVKAFQKFYQNIFIKQLNAKILVV